NDILLNIENFFASKEIYQKLGVPCKRGFLFLGPPGNGKTSLCRAIASEFDIPFCYVTLGRQDQRNFAWKSIFASVKKMTPCIVLIEDLDRVLENSPDETQTFLNALDGFESLDNILIIGTANDATKIDPALLDRPSRFDRVWKFELPDVSLREEFLTKFSKDHFSKEIIKKAAINTDKFSYAYLKEVVIQALLNAANENRPPKEDDVMNAVELLDRQMKNVKAKFEDEGSMGFRTKKTTTLDIIDPTIRLPRRKK
ncbi:MAG TPA: ATP-binding protein, partial [Nitrosopumilaceae archaeon]|nr:ATP-binding protein [Nitrosopumilaceae archaeon]